MKGHENACNTGRDSKRPGAIKDEGWKERGCKDRYGLEAAKVAFVGTDSVDSVAEVTISWGTGIGIVVGGRGIESCGEDVFAGTSLGTAGLGVAPSWLLGDSAFGGGSGKSHERGTCKSSKDYIPQENSAYTHHRRRHYPNILSQGTVENHVKYTYQVAAQTTPFPRSCRFTLAYSKSRNWAM